MNRALPARFLARDAILCYESTVLETSNCTTEIFSVPHFRIIKLYHFQRKRELKILGLAAEQSHVLTRKLIVFI